MMYWAHCVQYWNPPPPLPSLTHIPHHLHTTDFNSPILSLSAPQARAAADALPIMSGLAVWQAGRELHLLGPVIDACSQSIQRCAPAARPARSAARPANDFTVKPAAGDGQELAQAAQVREGDDALVRHEARKPLLPVLPPQPGLRRLSLCTGPARSRRGAPQGRQRFGCVRPSLSGFGSRARRWGGRRRRRRRVAAGRYCGPQEHVGAGMRRAAHGLVVLAGADRHDAQSTPDLRGGGGGVCCLAAAQAERMGCVLG
jgi:hypothetical protein